FCQGCILKEEMRVAELNDGKIPKWLKCMVCKEKTSFCPEAPKYHRLLIELIDKGQKREAERTMAPQPASVHQATAHPTLVYQALATPAPVYNATAPVYQATPQPQQTALAYLSHPPHPYAGKPHFRQH
ncbi:hypothetical protein THAOC_25112, partial [Thalassiosira oceanica]